MDILQKLKNNQRRIGLTGGIASGKTTITNYIRKHKNIPILDADNLSRELIKPNTYGYKKILDYFGNKILKSLSQLDSNWSFVDDSKVTPKGFLFAGISAGLKASNKKDLALILAPEGSIFSGMFTQSIVRASCVDICCLLYTSPSPRD